MKSGLSAAGLRRMHDVMSAHVERGELPGLVTVLSRRGETHIDQIGTLAFDSAEPMSQDTIFRLASMTKPITSVATMILVEECTLRLDDPVHRLLPELADMRVLRTPGGRLEETEPARRPITVRDLLTFRLGTGMFWDPGQPIAKAAEELDLGLGLASPRRRPEPDEWMRRFATLPLVHQPGERWLYGTGSQLLGVLIARAAGQSFETFLRERVFAPLGMRDTGFSIPEAELPRQATCYTGDPAGGVRVQPGPDLSRAPAFPAGGGGLVSTARDYLAFAEMMRGKGKRGSERMLSRPTIEAMATNQLTARQPAALPFLGNRGWGLGLAVVLDRDSGPGVPGRFGWEGGTGTSWYSDPHEDLFGILLTQRVLDPATAIDTDFWTCAYAAIDD